MRSRPADLLHVPYTAWRGLRWLTGDRSPFGATLKLTTRCTLSCRHCPWLDDKTPDLPTGRWLEIIREVRRLGARHLVMEGGEPTLRDDLERLTRAGRAMNMRVTIATNATRPLDGYSPDRFLVSVDGLEETHDRLRGQGAFSRMLENLPGAKAPRIALVSLSRENVHELDDVLKFFKGRLEGFWFSFVYDYGGRESLALGREEKREAARRIMELSREYPVINKRSYLARVGTERPCRDWLLYTVTANGKIHPGCMVEAVDACRCDDCELACHREFSDLADPALIPANLLEYLKRTFS